MRISTYLLVSIALAAAGAYAQTPGAKSGRGENVAPASALMPMTEGRVERVDKKNGEIVLEHGDLPNLAMPPMTMAFNVADKSVLSRLKKGDRVRFNAEIVKGAPTVTRIERLR